MFVKIRFRDPDEIEKATKRELLLKDFELLEKIDSVNLELSPEHINREKWVWSCDNRPYQFCDNRYFTLRRSRNGRFFCDIQAAAFFHRKDISTALYSAVIKLAMLGYIKLNGTHRNLMVQIYDSPLYDKLGRERPDFFRRRHLPRETIAYQVFFKLYFDYFAKVEQVDICADFTKGELKRNLKGCDKKNYPNTSYSEQHPRGKDKEGRQRHEHRSDIKCYDRTEKMRNELKAVGFSYIPNPMRLEVSLTSRHYAPYLAIGNFKGNFETVGNNFIAPIAKIFRKELDQVVHSLDRKKERPVFDKIFELKDKEHISNSLLPKHIAVPRWGTEMTDAEIVSFLSRYLNS